MDGDSDDSDEWGAEELDIESKLASQQGGGEGKGDDAGNQGTDEEDYWKTEPSTKDSATESKEEKVEEGNIGASEGKPMIIVDVTQIDSSIHSKFDRNSVNDSDGASRIRKQIESSYDEYSRNADLLANGTVIPCGSNVWRAALVRLRDERSGHYFVPIFPSTK